MFWTLTAWFFATTSNYKEYENTNNGGKDLAKTCIVKGIYVIL